MKKIFSHMLTFVLCVVLLFTGTVYTSASESGQAGFSVRAVLPENQIDTGSTYFDLKMEPGQKQNLKIDVFNDSGEEITIKVKAVSASTSRHGIIDYLTPDIKDETLKIPFSDIAEVNTPEITIPAGKSAAANVEITMPDTVYDGVVLGGIVFTKDAGEFSGSGSGIQIQNVYNYVVAVKLSETETIVNPDFELVGVKAGLVNYHAGIIYSLRNKEAAIAKNVKMDIMLKKQNSNTVLFHEEDKEIEMAPNSVIPYAVSWGEQALEAGTYQTTITIRHGSNTWTEEKVFTIEGQEANEINRQSVDVSEEIPLWLILALILILLLIVIVILLIIIIRKKKKEAIVKPF